MAFAPAELAPARRCAFRVIRRVFEQGAYADRTLHSEAAQLSSRDRALATQLVYGTVQRKRTLDYVAQVLLTRPLERLEPGALAALRLGLHQLLFLDGVPAHAAVNDSVELAKRSTHGGAGLVNAVLRRASREGRAALDELDDAEPASAAVLHSVPDWLAERWWSELGPDAARALLRRVNAPAEAAVRVNTLVAQPASVLAELPVAAHAAPGLPEGIVLEAPFDAHGSDLFSAGAIMPQSRGSMAVARALAPEPGERVLDLCAAPGAKTTHAAALLGDRGEVVAVERHPGRAQALRNTCARMRAASVTVEVGDARRPPEGPFARVLVDPPCSGLGTLQSRPDLRWRVTPEAVDGLAAVQAEILTAAAATLAPGGTLVYSVCTISRREGDELIDGWLAGQPGFVEESRTQLLPSTDGTDGFFIARLRRH